jgi:hypothetical protein
MSSERVEITRKVYAVFKDSTDVVVTPINMKATKIGAFLASRGVKRKGASTVFCILTGRFETTV